ncbi:MAG: TIGR00730 family Rossman fold protein [Paludibacter sp.]|nr:TIGR00730 family Rossman fold protein [Paludibacter sp.]
MKSLCVYCASSTQVDNVYFKAAELLGKLLVQNDFRLIYGGGKMGLMNAVADAVLKVGGEVTGIIPQFMIDEGWNNNDVKLLITKDMHERKMTMSHLADAVVALPGGCGTLDELFEIITWKQLGLFTKPVVILNINNYYDDLLKFLQKAADEKFLRTEHLTMWQVCQNVEDIFTAIADSEKWHTNFRKFAAI